MKEVPKRQSANFPQHGDEDEGMATKMKASTRTMPMAAVEEEAPSTLFHAKPDDFEQKIDKMVSHILSLKYNDGDADDSDGESEPEHVTAAYAALRALTATDVRGPDLVDAAFRRQIYGGSGG